jgi:Undecaprenyl-phosphate galactose phosphotransferase WbaP
MGFMLCCTLVKYFSLRTTHSYHGQGQLSAVGDRGFVEQRLVEQRLTAASPILVPAKHQQLRVASAGRWKPVWKPRLVLTILVLTDFLLSILVWKASSLLQGIWGHSALSGMTSVAMLAVITAWIGLRALLGLYPGYGISSAEQLRRHTYAVFATLSILAIFALGFQIGDSLSRLLLALVFLGLLVLCPFVQHLVKLRMKKTDLWGQPVVILGYKGAGANVASLLKEDWELGYDPVAIFDYRLDAAEASVEGADDRQAIAAVVDFARKHGVHTAIFAMPHIRREQLAKLADLASLSFRHVVIIPNLGGIINGTMVARDLAGTFGVEIRHNLLSIWARRAKRSFDLLSTVVGGLLISPILLMAFILIKLDSPGSAIFIQERPGQNGKPFQIYKFRTMYTDAEQRIAQLMLEDSLLAKEFEQHGKLKDDPRVTRVGSWLRNASLDELPQLWNVLKGDMSLVGPRPYLMNQVTQLEGSDVMISRVPPGITGLWQVSGRSTMTFEQRIALDIYYVQNWSIWLDLIILARTVSSVLLRRGAY